MTLIQSSTWTGIDINDVRPHARTRQLQHVKTIAQDQALLFEEITGRKVPPASGAHSISATPHVHDGTTGAVIPIPLSTEYVGGSFSPSSADAGDFAKFAWPCFFAPAGVTTVRVIVTTTSPLIINHMRARSWDDTLTVVATGTFDFLAKDFPEQYDTVADLHAVYCDLTVTPGLSAVSLELYDGTLHNGVPTAFPLRVESYAIVPYLGPPRPIAPYFDPLVSSDLVVLPASDHYLNGTGDDSAFTSFDDGMFTDGRAVSSYIVQGETLNDGLLYELGTGRPAGDNVDAHTNAAHYRGHGHGGSSSGWTEIGADIDQPLVATSYGVARQRNGSALYFTKDEPTTPAADWTGRIFGAHISTTSTTQQQVSVSMFRMPNAQSANIQGSGRLRFACLAYYDASKSVTVNVRGIIKDDTLASAGSTCSIDFTTSSTPDIVDSGSSGWYLSTAAIDYYGTGGVSEVGDQAALVVEVKHATAPGATPTLCLHSVCLYYEDA